MREHYEIISQRKYDESWDRLSLNFKTRCPGITKDEYLSFWNPVETVDLTAVQVIDMLNEHPVVKVSLRFYLKDRSIDDETLFLHLSPSSNHGGWEIDTTKDCIN